MAGFLEEATGYLPAIRKSVSAFLADGSEPNVLEEAYRLTHIIKGASSMVGLAELSHEANGIEAILEELVYSQPGSSERVAEVEAAIHVLEGLDVVEQKLGEVALDRIEEPPSENRAAPARPAVEAGSEAPEADEAIELESTADAAIDPEMLEVYTLEAEDHLRVITGGLASLEADPVNRETLQEVRRSVHTLKGAAAVVGFRTIAKLAHRMEDLLDQLYENEQPVTSEALSVLLGGTDVLENLGRGTAESSLRKVIADLHTKLDTLVTTRPVAAHTEESGQESQPVTATDELLGEEKAIEITADAAATQPGKAEEALAARAGVKVVRIPLPRLDSLVKLVSELVISRTVLEQRVRDLEKEVEELGHSSQRLKNVSYRIEGEYEASALGGMHAHAGRMVATVSAGGGSGLKGDAHGFDALEFDTYTEFHQLTRELAEATSDTTAVANELDNFLGDFDSILTRQRRLTNEIQDSLMRVRMLPLRVLATRLHRTIRVTADQERKKVDLVLEGEGVEMDTTVIEQIVDPLLHLLRNAVGHGIELPEVRLRQGKPERGTVRLVAFHDSTNIVLQIQDDGGGLDLNAVREKAVRLGYISNSEADSIQEKELQQLIFLPGFSTAKSVTEVSGRGVGMDVVRDMVHKLQGTIAIESRPGAGTTFTLRLPMTLTVSRALLVLVKGETFAVPLNAVDQILRVDSEQVQRVAESRVVQLGGKTYPLVSLSSVLRMGKDEEVSTGKLPVLVMRLASGKAAVGVEKIVEGREIVIKSLGSHVRRVRGLMGATLLGDGRVIPILNPSDLGEERTAVAVQSARPQGTLATGRRSRMLSVMIVDDSPSIRRINAALIKNAGWEPLTAKDGLDALEQLHRLKTMPDAILLDVEMPRMDGYELLATLKGQETYRNIPVIMITSRTGEKHRKKAMDLGASEYVSKPYHDDVLLGHIRRVAQ